MCDILSFSQNVFSVFDILAQCCLGEFSAMVDMFYNLHCSLGNYYPHEVIEH